MLTNLELYIEEIEYQKQLKHLEKKLKNKKIIIYGTGMLFELVKKKYDLSKFNIIGVADQKFTVEDKTYLGYRIIPVNSVPNEKPDYLLVATLKYLQLIQILEKETYKNAKFKIMPLLEKKCYSVTLFPKYFRKLIYLGDFIKALFKYSTQKIPLDKLQIWIGETCTLKCKNCSQLFPYIEQKLYDIDSVIKDTKKILLHCSPKSLHIIGGEPFTNKNIGKLIEFIAKINPAQPNKIITNGTIIPSEETLSILEKYKDDIYITISGYDCIKDRQIKFQQICQERNIKCKIINEDSPWFYTGDPSTEEIKDINSIIRNFTACWDRSCHTIADGELSICPRMKNSSQIFKHDKWFIENMPIKYLGRGLISRALIAACLSSKTYREACKYCYGVSSINNVYCVRAEQLK